MPFGPLVYVVLALCALLLGLMVYRYDMYDKEPWYMILLAAAAGGASSWTIGHLEDYTLAWIQPHGFTAAGSALVAATHEEAVKLLIVVLIALFARRHFNDPLDGIVYGSYVGLGFAIEESLFYLAYDDTGDAFPSGEPVRLLGHLVFGGIVGFAIGMARLRMRGWSLVLLGCTSASMSLHFLWDLIGDQTLEAPGFDVFRPYAAVAIMVTGMGIFGALIVIGGRWSRAALGIPRPRRLWSWPFSLLVRESSSDTGASAPEEHD